MSHKATMWNGGEYEDYVVFLHGKCLGVLTEAMYKGMCKPLEGAPRGAEVSPEYNRAFIYNRKPHITPGNWANKRWWRADGTPRTLEEIPKEYLTMTLLIV